MQFITNKISTSSNGKSFAQIVAEIQEKDNPQVKVASSEATVKVAEADEAPSSGQPEAEAKLVNEPEKENVSTTKTTKCDEAPSSGQPEAEAKLVNDPKVEANAVEEVKEASSEETEEEVKEEVEEVKEASSEETEEEETEEEEEIVEASAAKWVKVANLDGKSKDWLRKYYSNVWPSEFVDALLADK